MCTRSGTHRVPADCEWPHRPCLPPLSWHLTSLPPHWLPVAMPTSQVTSMMEPVLISDTGWLCVYLPANSTDKSDCWRWLSQGLPLPRAGQVCSGGRGRGHTYCLLQLGGWAWAPPPCLLLPLLPSRQMQSVIDMPAKRPSGWQADQIVPPASAHAQRQSSRAAVVAANHRRPTAVLTEFKMEAEACWSSHCPRLSGRTGARHTRARAPTVWIPDGAGGPGYMWVFVDAGALGRDPVWQVCVTQTNWHAVVSSQWRLDPPGTPCSADTDPCALRAAPVYRRTHTHTPWWKGGRLAILRSLLSRAWGRRVYIQRQAQFSQGPGAVSRVIIGLKKA